MMPPVRIAMWSGPRNISTAMMRAFENRADCQVWDEPLYGPYLAATGKPHPGAAEVIADQGDDWREVVRTILGPTPGDCRLWYQKHMTHHVLADMSLDWIDGLCNCFLIRDPIQVLASYSQRRGEFDAEDLGFPQQLRLFNHVCERSGAIPPVLDARDVLSNPEGVLTLLCERVNIDFDPAMLAWPAGRRDSDGVWGKYWYDAVWASTGFGVHNQKEIKLGAREQKIVDACRPCYEALHPHRLRF